MSAKVSKVSHGNAERANAKPVTERRQVRCKLVPEPKSAAPRLDPVGKYMHEHRGLLGKGYKLTY